MAVLGTRSALPSVMRVLAAVVVALTSVSVWAFELRKDSQGDRVRWHREVVFVVDPSLSAALGEPRAMAAMRAAVAELEAATPELTVSLQEGAPLGLGYRLDGAQNQNEIVAVTDWPYTDGALASTVVTVNARTDEIIDTDIAFNVEQHTFRVLDGPTGLVDVDDVQNTATHELGHALGLMHNHADARVVMFPRASAGEVGKRVLQEDDRLGLATLYAEAPAAVQQSVPVGCSSAGGLYAWLSLALLMPLLLRRRVPVRVSARASRRLGLLVAVGAAAFGASAQAQPLGVVQVRGGVTHRSASTPGLIVTTLDVVAESCVGDRCPAVTQVTVPGGRLGDLEQIVEHHPVPALGERLGLVSRRGRLVVFRLADADEARRFELLLMQSAAPQAPTKAPTQPRQPVVPAK